MSIKPPFANKTGLDLRHLIAAGLVLWPCGQAIAQFAVAPEREWSPAGNPPVRASLVSFDGQMVVLRLADGRRVPFDARALGDTDRTWLDEWKNSSPVRLPDAVTVDSSKLAVEVVSEDDKSGVCVYRTPHFEFTSEGKLTQNLLRDVARNFEATYELLKVLPWGIDPAPEDGDRFRALLVRSNARYEKEGGPPNSGGVYLGSRKMFVVPFESIGLREIGKSYGKASDYNSDTLVHELTHQMMRASLDILPQWVVEGTAEYTNILPLRFGTFRVSSAKTGLKSYLDFLKVRGGIPEPHPIEKILAITPEEWSETLEKNPKESRRMYFTAYLLVYYFMHMDGNGDGAGFVRYMREIRKTRKEIESYRKAVEEFKKLPGVESLPDGSYRWKGDLQLPVRPPYLESAEKRDDAQKAALAILLRGRTPEELAAEIKAAYRRAGLKL